MQAVVRQCPAGRSGTLMSGHQAWKLCVSGEQPRFHTPSTLQPATTDTVATKYLEEAAVRFPSPGSHFCWLNTSHQEGNTARVRRRRVGTGAAGCSGFHTHRGAGLEALRSAGCKQVLPPPPPSLWDSSQLPGSSTTLFQQDRDPPRPHTRRRAKASDLLQHLPWKANLEVQHRQLWAGPGWDVVEGWDSWKYLLCF